MPLNAASNERLKGVDPRLAQVVRRAVDISTVPFQITCGLRTLEEQRELVRIGASKTMKSYHLRGKAVDLVAKPAGKVSWVLADYRTINLAMQKAAKEIGVPVTWGGSWKSIVDGPHWQIEV